MATPGEAVIVQYSRTNEMPELLPKYLAHIGRGQLLTREE